MKNHSIQTKLVLGFSFLLAITTCHGAINSNNNSQSQQLKNMVTEYVLQNLHLKTDELVIEFPNLDKKFIAVYHRGKLKILPGKKRVRKGVQNIKCGIFENGQLIKTFVVMIRVKTYQDVITSQKRLGRMQVIKRSDLTISRCETTHISDNLTTNLDQFIGLRTKRMVKAGEILTINMVEKIPLIPRGSNVDIYFQKGIIDIILPGITRQDGNTGEEIRVKCLETNKIFKGSIIDAHTVIVQL